MGTGSKWSLATRDFNSGTDGAAADGADGFSTAKQGTFYANDEQYLGTQVGQCNLVVGERHWGGVINFPTSVGNGGVIYLEYYSRVPDHFDFNITNGSMKYIVFSEEDSSGTATNSRLHLQPKSTGLGNSGFRWIREGVAGGMSYQSYPTSGDLTPLKRNIWQRHNVEIGVGHVARSSGGNAYVKHSIDGNLLTDDGNYPTILDSSRKLYEFKFLDYYNDTQNSSTPEIEPYARRMWIVDIKLSAD